MSDTPKLYLNKAQLNAELNRCLNCKNQPCMTACPVNCNPHEFIRHALEGNFDQAVEAITRTNPMGQTCGLICPDKFCMAACTRRRIDFAVNIPKVQATILENYRKQTEVRLPPENGKRIAVVGAGPAGMAAAAELIKLGYLITVYEAAAQIGGALNLIPDSRLPHDVIEKDWSFIFNPERVTLRLNTRIDNVEKLLEKGFSGVIAAEGEPHCAVLNIPGEEHILPYTEYLAAPEKYRTEKPVAVIGGGAVAVDCAVTAKNNGSAQVKMFVRRQLSDMRITRGELDELLRSRIDITPMTSPVEVRKDNLGLSLCTVHNCFINDKLSPLPDSQTTYTGFACIIKAVGSFADKNVDSEQIFYAGDCKHGGSTIVEAIASGRSAAHMLHRNVSSKI